jgi:predicted  nucleic acid-binding Zn-ribbon protein
MILVIVAVFQLLMGGGVFSFDNIGDMAQEIIKDKDRAKQAVSVTQQATEEYKVFSENLDELSVQLVKMNKNYNFSRAEIAAFSNEAKNNRMAFFNKYAELRFQLKDLMTAEEWQQIHAK